MKASETLGFLIVGVGVLAIFGVALITNPADISVDDGYNQGYEDGYGDALNVAFLSAQMAQTNNFAESFCDLHNLMKDPFFDYKIEPHRGGVRKTP